MFQPKELVGSGSAGGIKVSLHSPAATRLLFRDRPLGAYHGSIPATASATRSFLEITAKQKMFSQVDFPNDQHEKS